MEMHRLASGAVLLAFLAGPLLAGQTTQPAADTFELRFRGRLARSDLGGLSTRDDQFFVAFSEGAVRSSPGQTSIRVQVTPVDPAALGPRPRGLQAVGKAYRLQVSYAPSGRPVESFAGEVKAGFSYSLAASTSLGDLSLVYSRDGRSWTRLETADAPASARPPAASPAPATCCWPPPRRLRSSATAPVPACACWPWRWVPVWSWSWWWWCCAGAPAPGAGTRARRRRRPGRRAMMARRALVGGRADLESLSGPSWRRPCLRR